MGLATPESQRSLKKMISKQMTRDERFDIRPRSGRSVRVTMHFLIATAFLFFLPQIHVQTMDELSRTAGTNRSKLDEWNDLLQWFRNAKTKEPLKDFEYSQEDATLEDEGSIRMSDLDDEWDRLVKGTSERDVSESEQPIRGASLAFVFDSTGSMSDELNQVKAGAMKILAALRDHPGAPIYNYIWVPFNDPGIGPVTVTTDPKLFQKRMEDVSVSGGGDCPENSIGAIKKALEASLPNSYVYVFTDAFAKDHRLQNEVLSLVQRKQAQVVFILTGECADAHEAQYKVYERIAETSSGQIYRLSRNEVNEVLKYVKVALQPHVVSLLSLNKPAPDKANPDKLEVFIDESLKQFTVSVSGANATINVTDPKGINVDGPPKLEKVLNLTNIKVVNVKEPDPGSWSVFINSDSNYTIRSTGLSKVNFNHGFSTVETTNIKETNYRPLKGARSFLLIQTSDAEKVHNITSVDFVSLSGDVFQHLNLIPVPGMPGLYKAGSFVPPSEFFYLGVTGFGQDGLPFKRLTSTAVSGQLPEKPIITMKTKAFGRHFHSGSFKCYVESVVPFTVRWYKDGVFIGEEKNCSETCEVILNIEKFTSESEGIYSCSAKNVAGADSKSLTFSVIDEPPTVKVNSSIVTTLGDDVYLDCLVQSNVPAVVKWTQFTARNQHSGVLHAVSAGVKLPNNTLFIEQVKAEDEGWYVCNAANKHGESKARVLLIVKEPLVVRVEPKVLNFVEGGSARFTCSAGGKPVPRLEWLKDQQSIKDEDPSIFVEEINGNLNLVIDYLEKRNAGIYVCNAVNQEESVSATAELIYTEKPTVKAKENNLMVKAGSQVVMQCLATGYPEPIISWFKRENEISDDPRFEVEGGVLRIRSAESLDAGEYSCAANNHLGSDVDYIGLIVGSPPMFLQKPRDKKIQLNHNGTVACSAIGVPPPEVKWKRYDGGNLDESRMFVLSSGALRITRMKVEDAGQYTCTAENVFGSVSNNVSIRVTGVEKPSLDKNIELRNVEALSGNELSIPCGIILGNPPSKVKWFKNGVELQPNNETISETSGTLIIQNVTASDRGNYSCVAQNAAGNSSRSFEVLISESPKIKEGNKTELKAVVGGEIIIPCPVEGFPLPTVTWTKNGLPLPMSSTIFQDENGSLIIRNLNEENTGVYVCTAINTVGSTSKSTSIHVQVPPTFPVNVQETPINVVEGHVVMLNCNVNAVPEPTIQWFKNEEPLLQNGDQPKILRFVANMEDTGLFKCVVMNEAGFSTKEFNVTILVPPKILGKNNEESIKTKAGVPITLVCDVFGFPPPTILWQRNGMYLTQNTSEITISNSGTLTIQNVTKESAGAYTCDAENLGGITQRIYYLQVNYPPKIIEYANISKEITLKEGEEYSLTCLVEGNPKPSIIWKKNGIPIHGQHHDLIILEDNTLVFLQVNKETTGTYKCEAVSPEGSTFTEREVKVLIPPSLSSDYHPTKLEVNEGDSLSLTCPTSFSDPPPNIQWIKDGEPLDLLLYERSDEAQMKLSLDQRTLTITEAHPSDKGNYSCVATNLAGRTDAKFLVDVLMTPHFEEFNHVAHRTILTGGEVILNCSVSGNPQPKVIWRKENTPITPHNTPGVHVSLDKQHLMILNGRVHHTGTYICLATNKVNAKEREFYVTVLEPPQIVGPLQQNIDVIMGDNVTLECFGSGVPTPTYIWTKENGAKKRLNNTENFLTILNTTCSDSGTYLCDVTNTAGTRTKHFELSVLEPPQVENQERTDEVVGVVGGNITMKCKTRGRPKPEITWLHNGKIIQKRSIGSSWGFSDDGYASLSLTDVREQNKGRYTLLAANKAGLVQKNFDVQILVPPKLIDGHPDIKFLKVVHPFPIVLKCPAFGNPLPWVSWFFGHVSGVRLTENDNVLLVEDELNIKKSSAENSGVYVCLAENPAGKFIYHFNVTVIEPPAVKGNKEETRSVHLNETLTLHCNSTGDNEIKRSWFLYSDLLGNSSNTAILDSGRTLVISEMQPENSGVYRCLSTNIAGSTEILYHVNVLEPLSAGQSSVEDYKIVQLHHPFSLYCLFTGYPPPQVSWFKDGEPFDLQNSVLLGDSFLTFPSSKPEDAGDYKCVAQNSVGVREKTFRVDILVSGEWTVWSSWSECSISCGLGEQTRRRICHVGSADPVKVKIDKSKCVGHDVEARKCFRECQVKETWGSWTSCSTSCGPGIRRRYKLCDNAECKRKEIEEETCHLRECPINGQWSEWSHWSECSDPCGGGIMQRVRKCDSPPPRHGGEECSGWGSELKICNRHKCQGEGKWLPWSEWTPCVGPCGKSHQKRRRFCQKTKRGEICKGESLQMKKCLPEKCEKSSLPPSANLHVKGNLNGDSIDDRIDVTIDSERQILANLKQKEKRLPYASLLLSPLSWNTAREVDEADNDYSLTDGNMFLQSEIKYANREEQKMKHKGDQNLTVEIEVLGEVPVKEPHSYVYLKPLEQDYMRTNSNTLFSSARHNVSFEGKEVLYRNTSIHYDGDRGTMPFPVEKLTMKEIDSETKNVSFTVASTIGKKFDKNPCPSGFIHYPNYMHCQDINECEMLENLCPMRETCVNTFGSYKCVCSAGFRTFSEGCVDVDECSEVPRKDDRCSHFCHNTIGSFKCSCPFGFYLSYDLRTCLKLILTPDEAFYSEETDFSGNSSFLNFYEDFERFQEHKATQDVTCPPGYFRLNNKCKDYNECEDNPCDKDETCINFLGSYKCVSIPCPVGYERISSSKNCIKKCGPEKKCQKGATVSESTIFHSVTFDPSTPALVSFDEIGEPRCNVAYTRYRMAEASDLFQVRISNGRGALHSIGRLNKNTLYRVKIEAFSYDANNSLLHFTEFIIFVAAA